MRVRLMCAILLCVVLSGCGAGDDVDRAAVTGTVRVDGTPLAHGTIAFFPDDGSTGPSAGAVIRDGHYTVERGRGVPVGVCRVEIRGVRETGRTMPDPLGKPEAVAELVEAVPPEFNSQSTLRRTIVAGKNTLDFDLPGTASSGD